MNVIQHTPDRVVLSGPVTLPDLYTANAVNNNGIVTNIRRTTNFTGSGDSAIGTFSMWLKPTAKDGTQVILFQNGTGNEFLIRRETDNKLRFFMKNSSATTIVDGRTTTSVNVAGGWYHFHVSWDLSGAVGTATTTLNGSAETMTWTADPADVNADVVGFGDADDVGITNTPAGGSRFQGCVSDIFLDITQEIPYTSFISGGKPVDLSSVGSPIALFNDTAAAYANAGSGGDMNVLTLLTDCADSPSS